MNSYFLAGFEKKARLEKEGFAGLLRMLPALGAKAISMFSKPTMSSGGKLMSKALGGKIGMGFVGMDALSGTREGMQMADAGKGALTNYNWGRATV